MGELSRLENASDPGNKDVPFGSNPLYRGRGLGLFGGEFQSQRT